MHSWPKVYFPTPNFIKSILGGLNMSGFVKACVCIAAAVCARLHGLGEAFSNIAFRLLCPAFLGRPHSFCVTVAWKADGQWKATEEFWGSVDYGCESGLVLLSMDNKRWALFASELSLMDKFVALEFHRTWMGLSVKRELCSFQKWLLVQHRFH